MRCATLWEEDRLWVLENRVLREIFVPNREKPSVDCRKI
jgi:hypothetical protein